LRNRRAEFELQQHQKNIHQRARHTDGVEFFNVLTGPELLEKTEALLPAHRERLYPPTVTLSMFMMQVLNEDDSCQKAVNAWAARRAIEDLSVTSINTGAYCRARQRLPLEMAIELTRETGRLLCTRAPSGWRWRGRTVKLVDGSTISMPDTPENQVCFPQPSSQAEGVGFPLARILAVVCLSSGAILEAAMGACEGPGNSELGLLRSVAGAFAEGDVMLADAFYCNYFLIASLQAAGVDVVFEQNGARITDFRRGQRLGSRDHLVRWRKPQSRPQWMTNEQYQSFPDELRVREVEVDGHILVTTMLAPGKVCKRELSRLYCMRWHVELDLRNLKTTLGMEVLSCNTPQMNEKEFWVHLLAYNLIRLLMAQAAHEAGVHPRELSFKHTVQLWTGWNAHRSAGPIRAGDLLFGLIAQVRVGQRPGRVEPRARKRRPKPYPWLKVPRPAARRQIRLRGHLLEA
jgi:hypothetical protein